MDRDMKIGRRAGDRAVDDVDIDSQQILPIIAAVLEQLPRPRIAELYQRGLVDLHIAAAGIVKCAQLLVISRDHVGPEFIEAWIDAAIDILAAGAVVDIGGAGQGDLRRRMRGRFQHREIARIVVGTPFDAADDARNAPRRAVAMRVRFAPALLFGQLDADTVDAAGGEAVGIGAAAELAIGHDLQADFFLLRDDGADRRILGGAQLRGVDLAGFELFARGDNGSRTNKAADMIGTERRMFTGHWQAF